MNKPLLFATAFILSASTVFAADWKFCLLPEPMGKDDSTVVLFDAQSIQTNKGMVKVWTKDILEKDVYKMVDNPGLKQKVDKIVNSGYVPPYAEVYNIPKDQHIGYILYEIAGNDSDIPDLSKILWVFNCTDRQFRYLSVSEYDHNGTLKSTKSTPSEWRDIPPETNAETIMNLACQKVSTK